MCHGSSSTLPNYATVLASLGRSTAESLRRSSYEKDVRLPEGSIPFHIWRYSLFRALASPIRLLHQSLFSVLLLHRLIPGSNASLWTTSAHLVLGLHTGLVVWIFPFKIFFRILSSSILTMWSAHPNILILMSFTMFGSLYKLNSSLFHLGRQRPPSCARPYILRNIPLSNVLSICSAVCVGCPGNTCIA